MTFMRSPGLRQFFYRKRKLIFFGPFFSKFPVHYLRNGPEDFGSDDISEVPRPQTIFLYIYKKIFLGPFFFKFAVHYLSIEPEDFGSDDIYQVPWHHSRSKPMRHLKEHAESENILISGHIFSCEWVETLRVQTGSSWGKCRQHNGHNGHDQSTSK